MVYRRDFLKLTCAGIAMATLNKFVGERDSNQPEQVNNPRLEMVSKICENILEAQLKNDDIELRNARKCAVAWLFAEGACIFSNDMGYTEAGLTLNHYLYGDGNDLDYTDRITTLSNASEFWNNILNQGLGHFVKENSKSVTFLPEGKEAPLIKLYTKAIVGGITFTGTIPFENLNDFYALGRSTISIASKSIEILGKNENGIVVSIEKPQLQLYDTYDWKGINQIAGMTYLTELVDNKAGFVYDEIIWNKLIMPIASSSGIIKSHKDIILQIYDTNRALFTETASDIATKLASKLKRSLEGSEFGDDEDLTLGIDLGILQSVGAKEYTIRGGLSNPNNHTVTLMI